MLGTSGHGHIAHSTFRNRGKQGVDCSIEKDGCFGCLRFFMFTATILCGLLQVLDVIAPPYTMEFVQLFLPLIDNEDITGSLRSEDENDPVSEFIGRLNVLTYHRFSDIFRFFRSFSNIVEHVLEFSALQVYSMVTEITPMSITKFEDALESRHTKIIKLLPYDRIWTHRNMKSKNAHKRFL